MSLRTASHRVDAPTDQLVPDAGLLDGQVLLERDRYDILAPAHRLLPGLHVAAVTVTGASTKAGSNPQSAIIPATSSRLERSAQSSKPSE